MDSSVVDQARSHEMWARECGPENERPTEAICKAVADRAADQPLRKPPWSADCDAWREETVRYHGDIRRVSQCVTGGMAIADYGDDEIFGMRLALDEAIVNGLKHGNKGNPAKRVSVRYRISSEHVVAEVEDEGDGFNPDQVPNPLAPEYLERPSGRGLFLMRCYTSWMRYNERGNCVTLSKYRSLSDHS